MNELEQIKKELFNGYKRQSKILFLLNQKDYSESYIYSIANDIYPFFHSDSEEKNFFDMYYAVKKEFMEKVIMRLDEWWTNNTKTINFYSLENEFGRSNRSNIIKILRYCYLDNRFDSELWDKIKSYAPIEAKSFDRPFDKDNDL